jgi:hypothetical protein
MAVSTRFYCAAGMRMFMPRSPFLLIIAIQQIQFYASDHYDPF